MMDLKENLIELIKFSLSKRERRKIENPSFSHAAVLVPIFMRDNTYYILFTKRTDQVKYHKGEISFPGGMANRKDFDLRRTALREAFEEIGLREEDVEILGILDDIVTITGFIVTPYVGHFPYPYPFKVSKFEIEEIIEVPIPYLFNKESFSEREIERMGRKELVYSYQYRNHIIWGATARILKQFLDLIFDLNHLS